MLRDDMPRPQQIREYNLRRSYELANSWITPSWDRFIARVVSSTLGCSIAIAVMKLVGVL